jgi:tetratricopeptide (TPR) repeat protein
MTEFEEHRQSIKTLADQGEFDDALAKCNYHLAHFPESRGDILRVRAYVYSLQGMYEQAITDRKELIESGGGILRDYYQLGDNSLSLGRFADASKWLREALRVGTEQGETWFEGAALLLLSYTQMQLGQLQEAAEFLDQAVARDPECAMPVHGHGIMTHQLLRDEINRRLGRKNDR